MPTVAAALGVAAGAGSWAVPPPAVIVFDFDPVTTILGVAVRWQILAVAGIVLACLLLAALIAIVAQRRHDAEAGRPDLAQPETMDEVVRAAYGEEAIEPSPPDPIGAGAVGAAPGAAASEAPGGPAAVGEAAPATVAPATVAAVIAGPPEHRLRLDDLLFIVIAGVAGAVVGGRLGYALLYLDYYRSRTDAIVDASQGSLTLAGGVAGGIVTALLVAAILGAPVRRWLGVAIVPLLLALGLGKLAMVLGGAGQGLPGTGEWSTAFAGPGPWGSLAPHVPSDPSQVYEALTTGGALVAVLVLALVGPIRRRPVILFAAGIGLWAIGRFAVAYTWRDPVLVGQLNGDQLVTIGIAAICLLAILGSVAAAVLERWRRGAGRGDAASGAPGAAAPPGAATAAFVATAAAGGGGAAATAPTDDPEILPADEPHPFRAAPPALPAPEAPAAASPTGPAPTSVASVLPPPGAPSRPPSRPRRQRPPTLRVTTCRGGRPRRTPRRPVQRLRHARMPSRRPLCPPALAARGRRRNADRSGRR